MNSREKLEFETLAGVYKDNSGDPFAQIRLDDLRNKRLLEIERGVENATRVIIFGLNYYTE
jgi:hypothetical protein